MCYLPGLDVVPVMMPFSSPALSGWLLDCLMSAGCCLTTVRCPAAGGSPACRVGLLPGCC